jgi:ribonuclease P protein component
MNPNQTAPLRRLRKGAQIVRTRREGIRYSSQSMRAFACPSRDSGLRLAVTASRRVGKAVQRNRARRRLRAAFALSQREIGADLDVVVNARVETLSAPWDRILGDARRVLGLQRR